MKTLSNPFSRHMYLRIWLAVVGCVALLMLFIGWAWQVAERYNQQQAAQTNNPRELTMLSADGQRILQKGYVQREETPGQAGGWRLRWSSESGEEYLLQFSPRTDRPPRPPHDGAAAWLRPPFGFLWWLGVVGLAVIIGVFPVIRHLMKRLEVLRQGVQQFGEGRLDVRLPEQGVDEVAELARQFNASAEQIETLVNSHKTLLANASHELRSPLARIRMGLELSDFSSKPAAKAEIQRNIAELDQLIDEILLASRLDQPNQAHQTPFELVDLLGLAAEEAARAGADLSLAQPAHDTEIRGDAKLLRRAIRNLLENGQRYSSDLVELELESTATHLILRVSDRGPGIADDQKSKIFEPFYRVPGASERSGGVGLGLSLVNSIAKRHQGRIHCEDRPGGGSTFVLELPRQ